MKISSEYSIENFGIIYWKSQKDIIKLYKEGVLYKFHHIPKAG
jgi:hypothetical protein